MSLASARQPEVDVASHRFRARASVVATVVPGDATVLMDLAQGQYYTLNEVGTRAWHMLQEGVTLAAIIERLSAEYDVSLAVLRADTMQLLQALAGASLIVPEPIE